MFSGKRLRKRLVQWLKVLLSVGLLAFLVWDSVRTGEGLFSDERGFRPDRLWNLVVYAGDHWWFLAAAMLCMMANVGFTFVRWWMLVRAVDVPLPFGESMRYSFVGYLINLAPMGIVGGDLAKAVLVGRRYPGHQAELVASVAVDRVLGLYVLLLVATGAALLTGVWAGPSLLLRQVSRAVFWVTVISTVVLGAVWFPGRAAVRLVSFLEHLPLVGPFLYRCLEAFHAYGKRSYVLLVASLMTVPVHLLFALSIYYIGCGLFPRIHSLSLHFVFAPMAGLMQVIPISVGPGEFVLDRLFSLVPLADGGTIPPGQGMLTMLVTRLFSLVIATLGVGYFLMGQADWRTALHEAEEVAEGIPAEVVTPPSR